MHSDTLENAPDNRSSEKTREFEEMPLSAGQDVIGKSRQKQLAKPKRNKSGARKLQKFWVIIGELGFDQLIALAKQKNLEVVHCSKESFVAYYNIGLYGSRSAIIDFKNAVSEKQEIYNRKPPGAFNFAITRKLI